jgi:hypothetical protein
MECSQCRKQGDALVTYKGYVFHAHCLSALVTKRRGEEEARRVLEELWSSLDAQLATALCASSTDDGFTNPIRLAR